MINENVTKIHVLTIFLERELRMVKALRNAILYMSILLAITIAISLYFHVQIVATVIICIGIVLNVLGHYFITRKSQYMHGYKNTLLHGMNWGMVELGKSRGSRHYKDGIKAALDAFASEKDENNAR